MPNSKNSQEGLIASKELTSANVPPSDSELEVLETFCLTIDGYQGERYSIDDLLQDAERIERSGLETATLDELRLTAFIRQRQYRWNTDQGQEDPPLERKIREVVAEIRHRVCRD
jgi:hypothetical protein